MTDLASTIKSALSSLDVPVVQGVYHGNAETFVAFNMFAVPDAFSDDVAQADVWSVQVHLFAPFTANTTTLRRTIRRLLSDAGFTYPDQTDASEDERSSDGTEQHIVFTCQNTTEV